jgi:hypothetical protein
MIKKRASELNKAEYQCESIYGFTLIFEACN